MDNFDKKRPLYMEVEGYTAFAYRVLIELMAYAGTGIIPNIEVPEIGNLSKYIQNPRKGWFVLKIPPIKLPSEYREEVRQYNIKIINIFPGATATEIWPDNMIEKHSLQMMNSDDLADFIFDIYVNSNVLSPEEIVVRPISGDL